MCDKITVKILLHICTEQGSKNYKY